MRQKLTVIKPFSYAGRSMRAGTDFEASGRDARILVAIGRAKPASEMVAMTVEMPVKIDRLAPDAPDLDSAGAAWDETLHVSTRLKNADGTWRKRPGAARVAPE